MGKTGKRSNKPLASVLVCCTGLSQVEKGLVHKTVHKLGGAFTRDLTCTTLHYTS